MKERVNREPEIVLVLLLVIAAVNVLSFFFFTRIDRIVHGDLYKYGLQFSSEWAGQYWTYANLVTGLTVLAAAAAVTSIALTSLGMRRQARINRTKLIYSALIATGAAAITLSIIYASSILAFIGLGLIFWGIILAYIRTEEYTKKALLNTTASPQITTLNQIIQELDYKGRATYLPPKYLTDPEASKAYIPKHEETRIPTPEQIQKQEARFFTKDPEGILLTPPGAELAKLFEKTLETSFTRADLQYLQQKMPKLLIEDLEIARNCELEIEEDKIQVKIENSTYNALERETEKSPSIQSTLGSPLTSAIACALAKTTGKPITIEKQQTSEDDKNITVEYRIIETETEEEQTEK